MAQGYQRTLADHFQTLHWLLDETNKTKDQLQAEAKLNRRKEQKEVFTYLADCAEQAWLKCQKYYNAKDDSAAYYAAILLNPTLKWKWLERLWKDNKEAQKGKWLQTVKMKVNQLWKEEYCGKYTTQGTKEATLKQPDEPR